MIYTWCDLYDLDHDLSEVRFSSNLRMLPLGIVASDITRFLTCDVIYQVL